MYLQVLDLCIPPWQNLPFCLLTQDESFVSFDVVIFLPLVSKQRNKELEKLRKLFSPLFLIFPGITALGNECSVANDYHAYDENTLNKMILLQDLILKIFKKQ